MKRLLPFFLAILAAVARAEPPPPTAETVIVPYDPKTPPAEQTPDHLYLPYERFLQLWEAARAARTPKPKEPAPPVDQSLTSARYEAVLGERVVAIQVTLDLLTGQPWMKVALPFADATVAELQLDGAPAGLEDGTLLVEKPGRHRVTVRLDVPRPQAGGPIEWGVPRSAATLLVLTLPDAQTTATLGAGGTIEQIREGKRILTAALGPTEKITFTPHTLAPPTAMAVPARARLQETVYLSANGEDVSAQATFEFPGATQDRLTLSLDPGVELESFDAENVRAWNLRPEDGRQTLELQLLQPVKDRFQLAVKTHRAASAIARDGAVPTLGATAKRTELEEIAVESEPGLDVQLHPEAGLRQIPATQKPERPGYTHVGAYAGSGRLAYHVEPRKPQREATIQYLYQVGRRQVDLFASLELHARGDALLAESIGLPAGYTIETVQCPRPHEWWREGDTLHLRFLDQGPATPDPTTLVLYLVRREPSAPAALAIRPLALTGYRKITGEATLAAHQGVEVNWQLNGSITELKPEGASAQFQVLPPLERKRAFRFLAQDFSGEVKLQPLTPRFAALWALHAEAHESWVALHGALRLSLRQGTIDHARFSLPESAPEARVTGAELREARSKVEGGRRIYEVDFQNDVSGEVELEFTLDLPHAGKAELPAPLFPEAERATGFLAIENTSEGELQIDAHGLEPATDAELPWPLAHPGAARLYRASGPEWSATLSLERLEKAEGRVAFCAWTDLSTAFRRDGMEWHRAIWHLQNRALQFLPVRLPAGAELVSARVAGQSVRADAEERAGAKITLIPLIKTKPGELSYDVEAVYRIASVQPAGRQEHALHDPELVGITVERTFWHLWLPDGFALGKADGNMEAVLSDVARADKLAQNLDELQTVSKLARSEDASESTRATARDNFEKLKQEISADAGSLGAASKSRAPSVGLTINSAVAGQQNDYVYKKQLEAGRVLQLESENAKQLEVRPAAATKDTPSKTGRGWLLSKTGTGTLSLGSVNAKTSGNQVFLNDNVTWSGNITIAKPAAELEERMRGGLMSRRPDSDDSKLTINSSQVLSTARGNIVAQQAVPNEIEPALPLPKDESAEKPQMAAKVADAFALVPGLSSPDADGFVNQDEYRGRAPTAPAPTGAGAPAPAGNLPNSSNAIDALMLPPPQIPAGFGGATVPPPPPAPPLPVDHRTTIAVDFPTEGEPLHFKKVKGAASLEVSFHEVDHTHRGSHALILALAAGCLLTLQRLATMKQRKAAIS